MRTNYILIDFENVQPKSLDHLPHNHFKIVVFVGARQTKLPIEMATSLQRLGDRVEYIKISGNGSNALDFHIAYYIGRLAVADPSAYFHIISNDAGFDPLIDHLKANNVLAGRVKGIADIPSTKLLLPAERIQAILTKLQQVKKARPRTEKALSNTINTLFKKQLSEQDVSKLIKELVKQGHLTISSTKINYALSK